MPEEVKIEAENARPSIRAAVAESLGALSDRTRAQVVEHFAAAEATKQATAIIKGLDLLATLERDRYKIRPAHQGYDLEGKGVGDPFFTKEQVDQMKKLNEQIEKVTKAITKADDKAEFGDLYNLTK